MARFGVYVLPAAVAVALTWAAFDGGSYGLTSRNTLAIAVWWGIALALGLSVWPLARVPRAALLTGGLLAAFALFTAFSVAWSTSAEDAFNEFNRVVLFLGILIVAVLGSSRANVDRWCDGIAAGIVAVGLLALGSRCFPQVFPADELAQLLPIEARRLNYPLNYWNGLAALLALGLPLLLRAAVEAPGAVRRGVAVAPLPALAAAIYLTSSRAGTIAAAIAVAGFVALTRRHWAAAAAVGAGALGAALTVGFAASSHELVNGPFDSAAARSQGWQAALVIVLGCAVAGVAYGLGVRRFGGRPEPGRRVGWIAVGLVAVVLVAGLVAAHPVKRFQDFKRLPDATETSSLTGDDQIRAHLLSSSGNGRWQWWSSAVDEWRAHPVEGGGAGSFEAWWTERGTLPGFVRDAHSLYAETLGELGLIGFALLVAALGSGVVTGARRLRGGEARSTLAALLAGFVAYLAIAGVDWMWEMTVVTIVAMLLLGLLVGPATAVTGPKPAKAPDGRPPGPNIRAASAVVLVCAAPFVIGSQLVPLLATLEVRRSQADVIAGDGAGALSNALAARRLQGWAASTHLQLALVQEQLGNLPAAHRTIRAAIRHDETDWRLWLVRARIETKLGKIPEARRSLHRAAELNPRSALFEGLEAG